MERHQVTGQQLALMLRTQPSIISGILRGSRRCRLGLALQLAELTGVPVEKLTEWPKAPLA
jgi:hypothetical protein